MSERMHIPHSAAIDCAACVERYDYRVMPDRSCPHCGCPPPTVREDRVAGAIVLNEVQASFLRRVNTGPVNKGAVNRLDAAAVNKRAEYMREYMRKRRQADKGDGRPDA